MDGIVGGEESSVVSGGDELRIDRISVVEEFAELDPVVALHAGVWGSSTSVFIDEVVDDFSEIGLKVEGVEGDSEQIGDASSICRIAGAAASLFVVETSLQDGEDGPRGGTVEATGGGRFFAMSHEDSDDVVTGFDEEVRSHAAIDTTTHS